MCMLQWPFSQQFEETRNGKKKKAKRMKSLYARSYNFEHSIAGEFGTWSNRCSRGKQKMKKRHDAMKIEGIPRPKRVPKTIGIKFRKQVEWKHRALLVLICYNTPECK